MNRFLAVMSVLTLGSLLSSCAPTTQTGVPRVRAETSFSSVSFYPQQSGLMWSYLPEGEPASNTPYIMRSLGPTIFKGQPVNSFEFSGRGANTIWYRDVSDAGVKTLGFTKPGLLVSLEPAWQELPAVGALRVGATWQGQTKVSIMDTERNTMRKEGTMNYRYDIQERRQVTTLSGRYDVYVITRRISDDVGGLFPAVQQMYYSPYIGEVKTYEGLLLTGQNYSRPSQTEVKP